MKTLPNRAWMGPGTPVRAILGDLVRFVALALAAGIGFALFLTLAVVVLTLAAPDASAEELRPSQATSGSFLVRVQPTGRYVQAPTLATDVEMEVAGLVARVTVSQTFRNESGEWIEGVYVFPLPENAAVDRLRMNIGERVIEGVIREREQARLEFEGARDSGRRAALLEQERPNLFTSSVANLGPGETLIVEIEYQQMLRLQREGVSLRFPLVVAPRYIPGAPTDRPAADWSPNTDQVPDASRITPPVLAKGEPPRNFVTLRARVDAGFPVASVASRSHKIATEHASEGRFAVALEGEVPADRDFELTWTPQPGALPRGALFAETLEGDTYLLLTLFPPAEAQAPQRQPRDVVFIVDTSGSMHGESLAQAKRALFNAIDRLGGEDAFNVIQFNSRTESLFPDVRRVGADTLAAARRYVEGFAATGGTEMRPALEAALRGTAAEGRLRQVIFMTDGSVGNEDELFHLIRSRLGQSRLFTIGIGSAPNSHFMTKAAQLGRGTFTYIGDVEEVEEKMSQLFARLEHPVLSDIELGWPENLAVEASPQRIPDLYLGEPVVVSARIRGKAAGEVWIRGSTGESSWGARLALSAARAGSGVSQVWARRRIESLTDSLHEGDDRERVREAVVDLAMRHRLVTRYTSLVAVDVTPVRPRDADFISSLVPLHMPHGWSHQAVFGALPQTATPFLLHVWVSALAALSAALLWWRRR